MALWCCFLSQLIVGLQASRLFDWYYSAEDTNSDRAVTDKAEIAKLNLELAQTFAPYLYFDRDGTEFPMNPEIFYKYELKRDYAQRMNNHILDGSTNPTYFHVIDCSPQQIVIDYWWFYGYQGECNKLVPKFIRDAQPKWSSRHNGDWEHVMVELSVAIKAETDEYAITNVIYNAHGDHFTKKAGEFELSGSTHPHVYVGKIQKGSYHNPHKTLLYACLYWDDMRRKRGSKQLKTETNLVDMDVCRDDWCLYYGGDETPKKEWGPNGKDGIGTNPMHYDTNSKCELSQSKCDGAACDTHWQSKIDRAGRRARAGLKKVGGFFKKTGGHIRRAPKKIKKWFKGLFGARMGYDDYYDADYNYVTDEELYDLVVDQLYGDGYYEYMDDDDGDFGYYYYYFPKWWTQRTSARRKYKD